MLLNIYLGTIAISWATFLLYSPAFSARLKREGFKFVKDERTIIEKVAAFISTFVKGSIPVYNIVLMLTLILKSDWSYERIKNSLIKDGQLYKSTKDTPIIIDENLFKEETYSENIEKSNNKKQYEEMTREEKLAYLEHEKEILMSQDIKQVSPDKFNEQQGTAFEKTINKSNKK